MVWVLQLACAPPAAPACNVPAWAAVVDLGDHPPSVVGQLLDGEVPLDLPDCADVVSASIAEDPAAVFSVSVDPDSVSVEGVPPAEGAFWAEIAVETSGGAQRVHVRFRVAGGGVRITPTVLSFDTVGSVEAEVCAGDPVQVGGVSMAGEGLYEVDPPPLPLTLLPGVPQTLSFTAVPGDIFDYAVAFQSVPEVPPIRVTSLPCSTTDADGDGYSACDGDCVDQAAWIHPGLAEDLGGGRYDLDCDGLAGFTGDCDDWRETLVASDDADRDGVRAADGDCDDAEVWVSPALPEMCGDALDNDCDETTDDAC